MNFHGFRPNKKPRLETLEEKSLELAITALDFDCRACKSSPNTSYYINPLLLVHSDSASLELIRNSKWSMCHKSILSSDLVCMHFVSGGRASWGGCSLVIPGGIFPPPHVQNYRSTHPFEDKSVPSPDMTAITQAHLHKNIHKVPVKWATEALRLTALNAYFDYLSPSMFSWTAYSVHMNSSNVTHFVLPHEFGKLLESVTEDIFDGTWCDYSSKGDGIEIVIRQDLSNFRARVLSFNGNTYILRAVETVKDDASSFYLFMHVLGRRKFRIGLLANRTFMIKRHPLKACSIRKYDFTTRNLSFISPLHKDQNIPKNCVSSEYWSVQLHEDNFMALDAEIGAAMKVTLERFLKTGNPEDSVLFYYCDGVPYFIDFSLIGDRIIYSRRLTHGQKFAPGKPALTPLAMDENFGMVRRVRCDPMIEKEPHKLSDAEITQEVCSLMSGSLQDVDGRLTRFVQGFGGKSLLEDEIMSTSARKMIWRSTFQIVGLFETTSHSLFNRLASEGMSRALRSMRRFNQSAETSLSMFKDFSFDLVYNPVQIISFVRSYQKLMASEFENDEKPACTLAFHGTTSTTAMKSIERWGFDAGLCSKNSIWGWGIYFAEQLWYCLNNDFFSVKDGISSVLLVLLIRGRHGNATNDMTRPPSQHNGFEFNSMTTPRTSSKNTGRIHIMHHEDRALVIGRINFVSPT